MKKYLPLLLMTAMLAHAAPDQTLTVAVFDFDSKDEGVRDLGPKVATLVNADLSADSRLILVERSDIAKITGEHELGLSGSVTPDSAAKIGQMLGAKVLVTGRVFKADEQTILVAKIIGTETSRVYGEIVQGGSSSSVADLSASLAKKIAADVTEKSATLVAAVEPRDEWMDKLKKSVVGSKLPVVQVKIDEQHYGSRIIDPAAMTELSMILQQCGFTLADANSTNRPSIEITGSAFSAFGMQRGNLISCKARVELQVRDIPGGNILAVDRQTSVAVDITEQTAAKSALENASDELARRLVPRIVK